MTRRNRSLPKRTVDPAIVKRPEHYWYSKNPVALALLPLSWLFRVAAALRRCAYRAGWLKAQRLSVPVIVAGNITVGGAGKTPLVIWLVEFLCAKGYRPGVVSRGYGGNTRLPRLVLPDSDTRETGDEAVLLARRCACPVMTGKDRVAAARALTGQCDVVVSDDGLQHYRLARDIEIAVVDGARRFGNGFCLPAGPLREPVARLKQVDMVVVNGGGAGQGEFSMRLEPLGLRNLQQESVTRKFDDFRTDTVHAVAGIGHPQRFFVMLREHGLAIIEHAFPDHHPFSPADLDFADDRPVLMTEKDAVKCKSFAKPNYWYLPVQATLDNAFAARLMQILKERTHGQKTA